MYTQRLNLSLPIEMHFALKKLSLEEKTSMSKLLLQAAKEFLEKKAEGSSRSVAGSSREYQGVSGSTIET
ncbi:MAG: hypothetical protein MRJ65_15525 [Candidatus Brocadiaceae bacterium]|nr:hypothetical protein [Candidatus Brocadiaceae bacterium]